MKAKKTKRRGWCPVTFALGRWADYFEQPNEHRLPGAPPVDTVSRSVASTMRAARKLLIERKRGTDGECSITIDTTGFVAVALQHLLQTGLWGRSIEAVAEELIRVRLRELEQQGRLQPGNR